MAHGSDAESVKVSSTRLPWKLASQQNMINFKHVETRKGRYGKDMDTSPYIELPFCRCFNLDYQKCLWNWSEIPLSGRPGFQRHFGVHLYGDQRRFGCWDSLGTTFFLMLFDDFRMILDDVVLVKVR